MKNNTGVHTAKDRIQAAVKYFLIVALAIVFAYFSFASSKFFSFANIRDILRSAGVLSIAAMGMMLCLTMGDMNFAVGAQISLSAAVIGVFTDAVVTSWSYPAAVVLGILSSVLVGLLTALFVVTLKVPAFIGTLGVQMIITGVVRFLTKNTVFFSFNWGKKYTVIGQTNLFGILPLPLLIAVIIDILIWILMTKTTRGRKIFALGANATASRQMGINIEKEKYFTYILCGLLTGVAGLLQTSINMNASVSTGSEMLLPAIAACMLGATFLTPGKYNVWGTVIACVFSYVIQYGVVCMGLQFNMREVIQGIVLIVAISGIALVRKEGLPQVKFE